MPYLVKLTSATSIRNFVCLYRDAVIDLLSSTLLQYERVNVYLITTGEAEQEDVPVWDTPAAKPSVSEWDRLHRLEYSHKVLETNVGETLKAAYNDAENAMRQSNNLARKVGDLESLYQDLNRRVTALETWAMDEDLSPLPKKTENGLQ